MPTYRPRNFVPQKAEPKDRPPLRVASSQFPLSADIEANAAWIRKQIDKAAQGGARIVHFCETALSGYVGYELTSLDELDFAALARATDAVCEQARSCGVWVLLGSTHRLSGGHLPHNSVYVISDQGEIVDRYDKRFCTGLLDPEPELDLKHYTPGDHATTFDVDGYHCGVLICYDYRFPELYRELAQLDVEVIFQSFHNARFDQETFEFGNIWKEIVPATMMCHAATNYFWISATNSSKAIEDSLVTFAGRCRWRRVQGEANCHTTAGQASRGTQMARLCREFGEFTIVLVGLAADRWQRTLESSAEVIRDARAA